MKTSDEWVRDIYEKAEKRFAKQKRRRKMFIGLSSSAACLSLILCSVMAMSNLLGSEGPAITPAESSGTNQTPEDSHNSTTTSVHAAASMSNPSSSKMDAHNPTDTPHVEGPSKPPVKKPNDDDSIKLFFADNRIINQLSAAPKYHDPKDHHQAIWTEAQMMAYLGVDLVTLPFMPADLTYVPRNDFQILYHNSGDIVEDHQAFVYKGDNRRRAVVLVSKIKAPYDCIYQLETNKKTAVGGTQVVFCVQPNSKDPSKYDFICADFEVGGLYYRVKADNLTPKEVYKIVEGITKIN